MGDWARALTGVWLAGSWQEQEGARAISVFHLGRTSAERHCCGCELANYNIYRAVNPLWRAAVACVWGCFGGSGKRIKFGARGAASRWRAICGLLWVSPGVGWCVGKGRACCRLSAVFFGLATIRTNGKPIAANAFLIYCFL